MKSNFAQIRLTFWDYWPIFGIFHFRNILRWGFATLRVCKFLCLFWINICRNLVHSRTFITKSIWAQWCNLILVSLLLTIVEFHGRHRDLQTYANLRASFILFDLRLKPLCLGKQKWNCFVKKQIAFFLYLHGF